MNIKKLKWITTLAMALTITGANAGQILTPTSFDKISVKQANNLFKKAGSSCRLANVTILYSDKPTLILRRGNTLITAGGHSFKAHEDNKTWLKAISNDCSLNIIGPTRRHIGRKAFV